MWPCGGRVQTLQLGRANTQKDISENMSYMSEKIAHTGIELERLRSDNVSLRVHADNLRDKNRSITVKFEQTENRLAMAIEEIDRLKEENDKYRRAMQENCELRRIAESFREQTRKALAEQYKLSVRITELEREKQANE